MGQFIVKLEGKYFDWSTEREAKKAFIRVVKLANQDGFTVFRKGHRDYQATKVKPAAAGARA